MILWLWRGHNKVNARLKGEASEDPKFPKQQFPPASICADCRDSSGQFVEQRVLQFIVNYYSDVKIDQYKVGGFLRTNLSKKHILKPSPAYKVSEFANGKLEKVAERRLNPKFDPMAGKVGKYYKYELFAHIAGGQTGTD